MYYKEKLSRARRVRNNYRRVCHLEREIFPEKVTTSGQRSEVREEVSCVGVWGKMFQAVREAHLWAQMQE